MNNDVLTYFSLIRKYIDNNSSENFSIKELNYPENIGADTYFQAYKQNGVEQNMSMFLPRLFSALMYWIIIRSKHKALDPKLVSAAFLPKPGGTNEFFNKIRNFFPVINNDDEFGPMPNFNREEPWKKLVAYLNDYFKLDKSTGMWSLGESLSKQVGGGDIYQAFLLDLLNKSMEDIVIYTYLTDKEQINAAITYRTVENNIFKFPTIDEEAYTHKEQLGIVGSSEEHITPQKYLNRIINSDHCFLDVPFIYFDLPQAQRSADKSERPRIELMTINNAPEYVNLDCPVDRQTGQYNCFDTCIAAIQRYFDARGESFDMDSYVNPENSEYVIDEYGKQDKLARSNETVIQQNPEKLSRAINYINVCLKRQRPVLIGVNYRTQKNIGNGEVNSRTDGVTDHFLVIRAYVPQTHEYIASDPAGDYGVFFGLTEMGFVFTRSDNKRKTFYQLTQVRIYKDDIKGFGKIDNYLGLINFPEENKQRTA